MKIVYNIIFRLITIGLFLLLLVSELFSQTSIMLPYVEASTSNFEVVISYNKIEPNKEAKLTLYISDFKTNLPIDNAKVGLDIVGIDNSKIKIQSSLDSGVYEVLVEFPEIKKYNFLLSIDKGETTDLIAINDVDIGKIEDVTVKDKEAKSFITIIHENLFLIIIAVLVLVIASFVFYRLGKNKSSPVNLNNSKDVTSEF